MVNKSVAAAKRKRTIDDNKQKKIAERNAAIKLKFQNGEERFQLERARRLAELFPPTEVIQETSQPTGSDIRIDELPDLPEDTENDGNFQEPMNGEF